MTLLPPPPRLIRPRYPAPILKAILFLFMYAVWAATIILFLWLIHEGLLRKPGKKLRATLLSFHERKTTSGSYYHVAKYRYTYPGQPERDDESKISYSEFHRLRDPFITLGQLGPDWTIPPDKPAHFEILAYHIGPLVFSRAVEHEWRHVLWLIPSLFGPLGLLLSYALYLAAVVRPRRDRHIYSHGATAPGVVTGKTTRSNRYGTMYFIYFEFTPAGAATTQRGVAFTPKQKLFDQAQIQEGVTVLYDPDKPKRSFIYEYGPYIIDGADSRPLTSSQR
jgi:hypothetical protein